MISNILLKNVYKRYFESKTFALEDINLDVKSGEFFCLVGPSGCGKSTILKIIAGLEQPTSGTVAKSENLAMVFQNGALLPWLSVFENVAFGLRMKNTPESKVKEIVNKYIKMVNLEQFEKKYPRELSVGQKQRVGLARALVVDPEVLLLDEPFSALDPLTTDELGADLLKIWKEEDLTIIMVSHSLEEAVLLADNIGVMSNGKIKGFIENSLPRPRREDEKPFMSLVDKTRNLLE